MGILYLLDGHGIIFRSYYAHIRRPLRNSKNENTSAIFGFCQTIKKIFDTYNPSEFGIVFDDRAPSFRNKIYPSYKAHREKAPEDLSSQIPIIFKIVDALRLPSLCISGVEADDVLATIATERSKKTQDTHIISTDKDLFQVVTDYTHVIRPTSKNSDWTVVDIPWLKEHWEISPHQMIDYLALVGDTSDNVPGVSGIGEKSALSLLHQYGSLRNIYDSIQNMRKPESRWKEKLIRGEENAWLSYTLVKLRTDVSFPAISFGIDAIRWEGASSLLSEHDIRSFSHTYRLRTSSQVSHKDSSSATHPVLPTTKDGNNTRVTHAERSPHTAVIDESSSEDSTREAHHSPSYRLARSMGEIEDFIKTVRVQGALALFVVPVRANDSDSDIAGIALSAAPHSGIYIPFRAPKSDLSSTLDETQTRTLLGSVCADEKCTLVFHDVKRTASLYSHWGIEKNLKKARGFFDTLIAGWMCDVGLHTYSLSFLSTHFLSHSLAFSPEVAVWPSLESSVPVFQDFTQLPLSHAMPYAAENADVIFRLYKNLSTRMKSTGLDTPYYELELPITELLLRMEAKGIAVDAHYLHNLSESFGIAQRIVEEEIYALCEKKFNIDSPKQLQKILFSDLKLSPLKKNKTGLSTNASVLHRLSSTHPVPKKILEYRHLAKLQNTYTKTLPERIDKKTGRIHTTFHQIGTETGRISSVNPNLQNIPVRDSAGQQIRSAFVASKDCILLCSDYSQIELVVLAHLSLDETLMRAFSEGVDIHTKTASILMNVDESSVDNTQRTIAKSINFGILYGMSAFRLGNDLKIPQARAAAFIEDYFSKFSGVARFIREVEGQAFEKGYVETLFGHRRFLPSIRSRNQHLQAAAKRMAINTVVQGSAADIVKRAMLSVDRELRLQKLQSVLLLQIHDELLLECPKKEKDTVVHIVRDCMQNACPLAVPLRVSIRSGSTWGTLS